MTFDDLIKLMGVTRSEARHWMRVAALKEFPEASEEYKEFLLKRVTNERVESAAALRILRRHLGG
jgi:hypothetical protein